MKRKPGKIAGIGEVLWDMLPGGKKLGGAPCNFAFHALQAGFDAHVVSSVGIDREGEEICQVLDQLGLNRSFVQRTSRYPTGTVTVKLDLSGVPDYTIHENVAWDHIEMDYGLEALAGEVDAVCFGSLAQRSRVSKETIWRFLELTRGDCLRVFDINLRQDFYERENILKSLDYASVLKLNEEELPIVAGYLGCKGDAEGILQQIKERFSLQLIAYTKGANGSILLGNNEISHAEVPRVEVVDTVGAGDSFTAILVAGLLNGLPLHEAHTAATEIAAYVCSRKGATPGLPKHLARKIRT